MTQYLDWKVGDRVVCINADPSIDKTQPPGWVLFMPPEWLIEGCVYTIAGIGPDPVDDTIVVYLEEIGDFVFPEEAAVGKKRHGFLPIRFRKVQPRKTSIAVFTALLNGAKERERV